MARRIPLPRLTQSQRTARWKRERRQQAVIVVLFSTVLLTAVALLLWTAADRYYTANLRPAATIGDLVLPWRDYAKELKFQLVKFFHDNQIPAQYENDPRIAPQKAQYESIALEALVEMSLLREQGRLLGVAPTETQVDERYQADFGQFRTRHVLIQPDPAVTDKDAADKAALAKAQDIAKQLKAAPRDDALWKKLAAESSADPGSKDQGGELGWVGSGQFVSEFENVVKSLKQLDVSDPAKSSFGYHVIQLEERRGPEFNEAVTRWLASGISLADIKEHSRLAIIRDAVRGRVEKEGLISPTSQVRIAQIVINTPRPTAGDFQAFTDALRKLSTVTTELENPDADFAAIAKEHSEGPHAAEGGDAGWYARGMLTDIRAEDELFSLEAGKKSTQYSKERATTIYKVLEKDPARSLTDDQKTAITKNAYNYLVAKLKLERGVRKLVPGHELD